MSLMGQVFEKLLTVEGVLIQMINRACFWKLFDSRRVSESEKLLKSAEKYFDSIFFLIRAKLS